ncbi:hypothetical protein L7F22_001810 [Adiantum nelumboides]|nr:hypothetical protein [Adiantum nelumboides]
MVDTSEPRISWLNIQSATTKSAKGISRCIDSSAPGMALPALQRQVSHQHAELVQSLHGHTKNEANKVNYQSSAIEDIKFSLGLSSYTGDPCLPVGYGYDWLNCSGASEITALLLSKHGTGGDIPRAINLLTTLTEIYLDGNNLQGNFFDLSALLNLKTLDLSNNRLNGSIPDSLASLKNLEVLFSGNPLCESNTVECSLPGPNASSPSTTLKKSNIGALVGGAIAGISVVAILIATAVYYFCLKKKPPVMKGSQIVIPRASSEQELQLNHMNESRSPGVLMQQRRIPLKFFEVGVEISLDRRPCHHCIFLCLF